MEAVFYVAALHIDAEHFALGAGAAQMRMSGFAVFIQPYKHAVVVRVVLIEQLLLHKRRDHIPVDAPVFGEIGIHPAHSQVRLRQRKGLWLLRLRLLLCNGNDALSVSAQQHGHSFREGLVIELPHEADGVSAPPRSMIIPPVGAYSDAVVAGQPVLPPGPEELLAPVTQKRWQVNLVGLPFFCGCEIYKFSHALYLLLHGIVIDMMELLVLVVISLVSQGYALLLQPSAALGVDSQRRWDDRHTRPKYLPHMM